MTLLEEYYELNEKENVTGAWRIFQILLYVIIAFFGICTGYVLAIITKTFDENCYLYGNISFDLDDSNHSIINSNSSWALGTECDFCQYTMICAFIFASIWATFFLMCGRGGKALSGLSQPWRIVLPALLFNFSYFIIALLAAIKIAVGTDVFCTNFDNSKDPKWKQNSTRKCEGLQQYINKNQTIPDIVTYINLVDKFALINAVTWLISCIVLLLRIFLVADFDLYRICVFSTDKDNEGEGNIEETKSDEVALIEYESSDDVQREVEIKNKNQETDQNDAITSEVKVIREEVSSTIRTSLNSNCQLPEEACDTVNENTEDEMNGTKVTEVEIHGSSISFPEHKKLTVNECLPRLELEDQSNKNSSVLPQDIGLESEQIKLRFLPEFVDKTVQTPKLPVISSISTVHSNEKLHND